MKIAKIEFHWYNSFQQMLKRHNIVKYQSIKQIAQTALKECLEKVPFLQIDRIELSELDTQADFLVQVSIQDRPHLLMAEVKNNGQPRMARLAVYQLKEYLKQKSGCLWHFHCSLYFI